ncbi:MAG: pilus assembly protein PilP [Myxococcota bacterium]
MRRRSSRLAVTVGLVLALGACGEDETLNGAPIDTSKVKKTKKADAEERATSESALEFSYSPVGKRDPFRSYLADLSEAQAQTISRPVQATERFELDQYRLTGLITGTSQPKALVEDPEGVGHTVRIGSYIGKNGGVVRRITANGFVVTEEFRAPTGELVKVPITVKLPRAEIEIIGDR